MGRSTNKSSLHAIVVTLVLGLAQSLAGPSQGQDATAPEDSFASENAVLDTSILFAIGAREARQELRGAFGWPTFQEGLVEGFYYRFDPDGYARFAPSPRLDTDVFEVICRPRTLVCMARKDTMQVTLNNRGQVQLEIANITENDKFVLADGISELPLPPTIIQPLEPRMELLLAGGGELVIRRNGNEVGRISLAGFSAVVPYLRWVAAHQDYTVLPRGWPVPNAAAGQDNPGLTQTTLWPSPMPQPQMAPQNQQQTALQPALAPQNGNDVAEVRAELNDLRKLLLDQQVAPTATTPAASGAEENSASPEQQLLEQRIAELAKMTASLQQQLLQLQTHPTSPAGQPRMPADISYQPQPRPTQGAVQPGQPDNTRDIAQHLDYLMTEIGLAPDVALMVVQQAQQSQQASADLGRAEQDSVINDILVDLRSQLPAEPAQQPTPSASGTEYRLLSDYLRSTILKQ